MIGVCIVTYNQEQYIAQAIESVLMQEDCGHEVAIYVGEDNSTDGTLAICEEIAKRVNSEELIVNSGDGLKIEDRRLKNFRIKVIHNENNLGLVGNTMKLLDIMRKEGCEYIAMLDGDDYWSDPKKLQKQMAYFNAHPEYGLVHTYVDSLYPDGIHIAANRKVPEGDVWSICSDYTIGNCSVVFQTECLGLINFEEIQKQGLRSVDYSMYIIFASKYQFGFLPEHTAVWRRGIESVSGTADMEKQIRYVQNDLAQWRYLAKLFPDKWSYSEEDGEKYLHMCAFNIASRYGNRERALLEAKQMSDGGKKRLRMKIIITRSRLLFAIWRRFKR